MLQQIDLVEYCNDVITTFCVCWEHLQQIDLVEYCNDVITTFCVCWEHLQQIELVEKREQDKLTFPRVFLFR